MGLKQSLYQPHLLRAYTSSFLITSNSVPKRELPNKTTSTNNTNVRNLSKHSASNNFSFFFVSPVQVSSPVSSFARSPSSSLEFATFLFVRRRCIGSLNPRGEGYTTVIAGISKYNCSYTYSIISKIRVYTHIYIYNNKYINIQSMFRYLKLDVCS